MAEDILQQMVVTAANGETLLFFDIRDKAEKDGRREEYEANRLENFMKLGIVTHDVGPMVVEDFSVGLVNK